MIYMPPSRLTDTAQEPKPSVLPRYINPLLHFS